MRPDLITSCIGMNDVTRPGPAFATALAGHRPAARQARRDRRHVVTTTFPDLEKILPVGRFLAGRVLQINAVIRAAAARHGFRLVDLYEAASMGDPDVWSPDRVHGSPQGHALFAAAAAEALESAWQQPRLGDVDGPTPSGRAFGRGCIRRPCGRRIC